MQNDSKKNLCEVCNMPQDNSKAGNIIDWINICNCNKIEKDKSQSFNLIRCVSCGKRINTSRKGSMTSWIFQIDLCSCKSPLPDVESSIEEDLRLVTNSLDELEKDSKLTLDQSSFPVDRYLPLKLIGYGESGVVYLCKDKQLNKKVAVKQLHFTSDSDLHSFQKEAIITSKLDHTHIVKVQDFGMTKSGIPYMVSEYVNGIALHKLLNAHKKFPPEKSIEIAIQICSGLAHAHEQGILHGDLCPENILLTKGNLSDIDAKLIDFGVARVQDKTKNELAEASQVIGSSFYLAPDKVLGKEWTERSEVYSIGCILFELLTGSPPYKGVSPLNTIQLHANEEIPSLASVSEENWSEELEKTIEKALSKDPDQRYSSIKELKNRLEYIYDNSLFVMETMHEDELLPEPETKSTLNSSSRSDPYLVSVIIFGVLVLVSGSIYLIGNDPLDNKSIEKQYDLIEKNTKGQDPNAPDVRKKSKSYSITKRRLRGDQGLVKALTGRYNFNDKSLLQISKNENIKSYELSTTEVNGSGFQNKSEDNISAIFLNSSKLDDKGLETISKLRSLKWLEINFCKNISSKGMKCLSNLRALKRISIEGIDLTDEDLQALHQLKRLRHLDLNHNSRITNQGISNLLKALPNLVALRISHTGATAKILEDKNFKRLRMLGLIGIDLSDKDLESQNINGVVHLGIGSSKITNSGVKSLSRLKNMRSLNLQYSPLVSKDAISYLRKKLPTCYIFGK